MDNTNDNPGLTQPGQTAPPNPAKTDCVDAWVGEFVQHLATDRGASNYTIRNYSQALGGFVRWHEETARRAPSWESLSRDVFRSYLRQLGRQGLSRAAIHLRFSAFRTFYKFLIRRGHVERSPIRDIALPKQEKRLPKFLTVEQVFALLATPLAPLQKPPGPKRAGRPIEPAACYRDLAMLETIYSCGLRISEICGLRMEDIDFGGQLVRVRGKGKKERLVPIGATALAAIQQYWAQLLTPPQGSQPVFLPARKQVKPLSPRIFQSRLKNYLLAAGLDPGLTPHKLRHSYATHMLDAGLDLRSVQELLGHAHLVTTQVYTHLTTERLKRAYDSAHPRA